MDVMADRLFVRRLALLGSVFFAGWAVGAPLCSTAADKLGRRKTIFIILPIAVLIGLMPVLPEKGALA